MEEKLKLKWSTINSWVGAGIRPFVEGKSVLDSNHIMCCGMKHRDSNTLHIFVLCLQSSALNALPHQIDIHLSEGDFDEIGGVTMLAIESCECSCIAGLSTRCKHIVAVLMSLNRSLEIEDLSCTDLTQQWGKLKEKSKEMYTAQPISNSCHFKKVADPYIAQQSAGDLSISEMDTFF